MGKIYACIAWCPRCQRYSHEARKFNDLKIFCRQRYYIDGKDIDCETGLVIISEKCAEFGSKEISQYVTEQLTEQRKLNSNIPPFDIEKFKRYIINRFIPE